ncbi:glycosyltransferase family 4 protein [Sphingomonas sp. 3-13AW]|uniref:glycosyltransferase family 4 protein n=1 Tax=Sphingomonas sp. 3-13AW TaxID=3050450 RepID=UPI003BB57A74
MDRTAIVYSDAPEEARELLGTETYEHAALSHSSSIRRLLRVFPALFRRDRVDLGVFQYMAPLTGRHIVFIHDLLPITHPHLFPLKVRVRTHLFFSLSIRRAAAVVAVSRYTHDEIARIFPSVRHKLRTVLNGPSFPPETYDAPAISSPDRYILTVGRIEPRKNGVLLAEAFRRAAVPGVRLVIVGAWDPEFPRGSIEGAGVEVRQGVNDTALVALYRGASLFAYPSSAEGFGVPLLDATLFGLPVIASNRTALPEVGGDLVEYFDPDAPDAVDQLANRIRGHFEDQPIRRPNEAARAAQAARFSWDRAAIDFLAAVDACAEAR